MLSTTEAFEKFRKRLELSPTESKDASKRQTEVRECIRGGFDVKTDFLSGSYRRHTKTKPLKDVDVLFVLGAEREMASGQAAHRDAQAFDDCLKKKYTEKDQTEICRRAVTVVFEKTYYPEDHEGKVMSIDAVPAFEAASDEYEIPDKVTGHLDQDKPEKAQGTGHREKRGNGRPLGAARENGQRAGTGRTGSRLNRHF